MRYRGMSENNISIHGEKTSIKQTNFSATLEDLPDRNYSSVIFADIDGMDHVLPELNASLDHTPPKIFGALKSIAQPAYLLSQPG